MKKKIYLIDGNSFIYRMFFGLPEFSTKKGEVVNAIFGMAKFFVRQLVYENPDYVVFITDAPGKNFRNDLFAEYKATRDRMPDNLKSQMKGIHEIITKMGIDIISIPGYEADDVIGTLAHKYTNNPKYEVNILSGDKDLYSLISENVQVYDTMKQKKFGIKETIEKFGIPPEKIIDFLAIVGDKADNIPGIEGFGPKKAVSLLTVLGTLEQIYIHGEKIHSHEIKYTDLEKSIQSCFKGKTFEKLILSKENAFLSKKLATIELYVDLPNFTLKDYIFNEKELITEEVKQDFEKYEFYTLLPEGQQIKMQKLEDLDFNVQLVSDNKKLSEVEEIIKNHKKVVLQVETTSPNIIKSELTGISIYINNEHLYFINRLHNGEKIGDNTLVLFLEKLLQSEILIIGHNIKSTLQSIDLFLEKIKNQKNKTNTKKEKSQLHLKI